MSRARVRREALTREQLAPLHVFRELDPAALDRVLEVVDGLRCVAGHEILTHEDSTRDVYFILEGTIRVNIYSRRGQQITFELLEAGEMFGELAAIDGLARTASCVAETEVLLARMPASSYMSMTRSTPALAMASLERLAGLVRYLVEKLHESHAYQVPERIRSELLRIAEHKAPGQNTLEITPGPTDGDIASRVGTTREAVNRQIAALQTRGLVRRDGRTLSFLDVEGLRELFDDAG